MSGPGPDVAHPEPQIRGTRGPAPEIVGAALAVIVLAVVGTSVLAGASSPAPVGASPVPSVPRQSAQPTIPPPVDPAVVNLLHELNLQLVDHGQALQRELDRPSLRVPDVASLIRQVNAAVAFGKSAVANLGGFLGPEQPGGRLAALYEDIEASATDTLGASVRNEAAYRAGAGILVKLIGEIPALQDALETLLIAPSPSPSLSPSLEPSPSPPPAPPPPPTALPASPSPTVSSPSPSGAPGSSGGGLPSPAPDEQVQNPDFEAGVGPPWMLLVGAPAAATVAADTSGPATGKTAARIDITAGSTAYAGISFQQAGLSIVAGGRYTVALSARGSTDREVRVRVASTTGASYLTRIAPIGTAWTPLVFTFIAPVTDSGAVLEIDLGRSTVTTLIDSVSFRPAGGV